KGNFYFMEMNTRIQVEHPITEMVTGIDIVKEQILIAAGKKLKYPQGRIRMRGHAMECRINAEDPANNFMPSPGMITDYYPPNGLGIRIDSHLYTGYVIPAHYDSLIGKLIVHTRKREKTIHRMKRALNEFIIRGIKTTIPFHLKMLNNEYFQRGEYFTDFVETVVLK
ncbi:MAG TPA: acetyl-CoA carboxylase biotin carboxylase subunit, partial [bacterium (Candidatus Stahlbacteria)]|nr:acetyl-CoA carboxylase biotin carboxylase subunit [Candidatus Stahlbacteria bacterium]